MFDAKEIYDIVANAHSYNMKEIILDDFCINYLNLKWINDHHQLTDYGHMVIKKDSIIIVCGDNYSVHIFLVDERHINTDPLCNLNKFEFLEVYNEHGWIREGKWVKAIDEFLQNLKQKFDNYNENKKRITERQEKERIKRFESLFE